YLDGELLMNPVVQDRITSGDPIITGVGTIEDAQNVAISLSSGALPVELEVVENRSVSALLGERAIFQSQQAAIYGVGAVILFMLLVYRLPGLAANLALVLYGLIVLVTLAGINATLTLPGIAGLILSVGMAVDANVIIFERIREELRAGTTVRAAIDAGFRNALSAILDSNITTLIAAAALGWRGTGPVRGFAVTLSIGVLASMITAVFVSRFLVRAMIDTGLVRNPARMFGVAEVSRA
ncbi:MAG TPA: protein translocase subunit SecD, partial [Bacillota bacterium]